MFKTNKYVGKPSFSFRKYKIYKRPGYREFLLRISQHPRIRLGIYSSITARNLHPIIYKLFDGDLEGLRKKMVIFDQDHCREMIKDEQMIQLAEEDFDLYKDLRLILDDPKHSFCRDNGFTLDNILVVDSEEKVIQKSRANAILSDGYTKEDVTLKHPLGGGPVRKH